MEQTEFKFFGQKMEIIAQFYGIFLVTWAIIISWLSSSHSITSFIPAFFGVPIFFSGWLSLRSPSRKKLLMHIAVLFGLLAFLAGLDFFRDLATSEFLSSNSYATFSKLFLLISGSTFCALGIKSFIFARKNKSNEVN